jgi:hypothetical protein
MTTHSFTLYFAGPDILTDENFDALFEAGCDDALFGERDGAQYGDFDREAKSFSDALRTALRDVQKAVPGLRVVRVEPNDLVTMAQIADRSGLTREYIRLFVKGTRGPGGFPPPVAYVDEKSRLWHWPDVAKWLQQNNKGSVEVDVESAELVAALNAAYALNEHGGRLQKKRDLALVGEVLRDNPFIVK